jgi:phage-related minor tail protein
MIDDTMDGINKNVTAVANKSEEYIAVAKLKSRMSAGVKSRDAKKAQLGEFVYKLFGSGSYDNDAVTAFCVEIRAIEDEITGLENEIAEIQSASKRAAPAGVTCSCGLLNKPGAKFCRACGNSL